MEILPGVHQIKIEYKGRWLQLYLLRFSSGGRTENLLMDCGDAGTPAKDILPFFASIGMKPEELTYVLITHPDVDHMGGIHAMKALCPQAKFFCGTDDRAQIETPEGFVKYRTQPLTYWHGMGTPDDKVPAYVERVGGAGKRVTMERTFSGGEQLVVGGRTLEIMHLPGHSMGHLGVYLPWENAAIIGDAVHHIGNMYIDGRIAFACTYMWVDSYLGTINRLEAMRLDKLFTCHWPNCTTKTEVAKFLQESRTYALHADDVILSAVKDVGSAGLTLHDVCIKAKPGLGNWAPEYDGYTSLMACGHLQRLASRGAIRMEGSTRPVRYIFESEWHGIR